MPDTVLETDAREFIPLWPEETEDVIMPRWQAWANEGLTEADVEQWVDTRPGNFWYIGAAPGVREAARWYDVAGSEMVAAAFPIWAWGEYLDDHAAGLELDRLPATPAGGTVTFTGTPGTDVLPGTTVAAEATDPLDPALGPREYAVTVGGTIPGGGTLALAVEATTNGSYSNAAAGAVTLLQSEVSGITAVTNVDPIVGGADPESDEALRERLQAAFRGRGPGTVRDYEIWARAWPGVGRATVIPVWNGPGTVLVIVLTEDGQPVAPSVVTDLQAALDPVPAHGEGTAPVGPTVTVATATAVSVTVAATVEPEPGYTLAGAGGALAAAIDASVRDYVSKVPPGNEIVRQQIAARIVSITGVHDVGAITINAVGANLTLDSDPAQIADLQPLALTEGPV